jgi:hypothetical protein
MQGTIIAMTGAVYFEPRDVWTERVTNEKKPRLPLIDTWAKITKCIKRGDGLALTAHHATMNISLTFDAPDKTSGRYDIRFLTGRSPEHGIVEEVWKLDMDDLYFFSLQPLDPFQNRFRIRTLANDRARSERMWFVGVDSFDEPGLENEANN